MTKGLKIVALSLAASVALSTSLYATVSTSPLTGSLTGATSKTKALELTTAASFILDTAGTYVPANITLTTLSNPTFNYGVQNGILSLDTNTSYKYYIVEDNDYSTDNNATAGSKVVAKYTAGSGSSTLAFGATGPQVSNGNKYIIVKSELDVAIDGKQTYNDINGTSSGLNVTYTQSTPGTSDTLTVNLGQGDSQNVSDRAQMTILDSARQVCASILHKFHALIDGADNFKSFQAGTSSTCATTGAPTATDDKMDLNISVTARAISAASTGDNATLFITASSALPAGTTASLASTTSGTIAVTTTQCTVAGTAITCPNSNMVFSLSPTITSSMKNMAVTVTVPGTLAISRTTFDANLSYDFNNSDARDYIGTNVMVLGDAGVWNYRGTSVQTPTINSNTDTNTMVKLNNDSLVPARVFWTLRDDAGLTVSLIEVASSEGNTGLAAGKSNTWLASSLLAAAKLSNPTFGEKFRGTALVTSETGVTAVSVMMIGGTRDRVIPLETTIIKP